MGFRMGSAWSWTTNRTDDLPKKKKKNASRILTDAGSWFRFAIYPVFFSTDIPFRIH